MTHAKKRQHSKGNKQLILFIAAILLIGGIIGGAIVGAVNAFAVTGAESAAPYGTRDGKTLTPSPSVEYMADNYFIPLECALPYDLQEYTYYLCQAYYIDFEFVMALMYTESSFNIEAQSKTNDYGLMQINECNIESLTKTLHITDIMEPYQNIRAGLFILRGLFEKYDDVTMVCMAYHMGEYGASVLWEQGIYETKYTNKVFTQADEYAAQFGLSCNEY